MWPPPSIRPQRSTRHKWPQRRCALKFKFEYIYFFKKTIFGGTCLSYLAKLATFLAFLTASLALQSRENRVSLNLNKRFNFGEKIIYIFYIREITWKYPSEPFFPPLKVSSPCPQILPPRNSPSKRFPPPTVL